MRIGVGSFREREKRLKLQSHGLIAPLKFHDGEHFPPDARAVEWTHVARFTSTAPAFWTSPRALELEDLLKSFAASVARIIRVREGKSWLRSVGAI